MYEIKLLKATNLYISIFAVILGGLNVNDVSADRRRDVMHVNRAGRPT